MPSDLKGRAAQIVACLSGQGPADARTISSRTGIPRSSVTRVCHKLVDDGLIFRLPTHPITYQPTSEAQPPEWIKTRVGDGPEPMCKAFYEACRRALRSAPDRSVILENEGYLAAAAIWDVRQG